MGLRGVDVRVRVGLRRHGRSDELEGGERPIMI